MCLPSEMQSGSNQKGGYRVRIYDADLNFQDKSTVDPIITGRKVAEMQGARSADKFVVLQCLPNGATEDLRLEEEVKLRDGHHNVFLVAEAGGTSNLFADDLRVAWFDLPITAAAVRFLTGKSEEFAVFQDFPGQASKLIDGHEKVSLEGKGVERFHTELIDQKVTVYLAEVPHKIKAGVYTTEQLKKVLGVPENYLLDLVSDTGFIELKPGDSIAIKEGMKFVACLPSGHSS